MAQFTHRAIVELEIGDGRLVLPEPKNSLNHFFQDLALSSLSDFSHEIFDSGVLHFFFHNKNLCWKIGASRTATSGSR